MGGGSLSEEGADCANLTLLLLLLLLLLLEGSITGRVRVRVSAGGADGCGGARLGGGAAAETAAMGGTITGGGAGSKDYIDRGAGQTHTHIKRRTTHQLQHQHQLSPKEGGGVDERVGLTDISAFIFAVVAKSFADFPSYHIPPLPTYKRHNGIVCIHICIHLHKQTEQCKHARRRLAHTYIILCFQIRFLLQKNTSSVDVAHGHGNQ